MADNLSGIRIIAAGAYKWVDDHYEVRAGSKGVVNVANPGVGLVEVTFEPAIDRGGYVVFAGSGAGIAQASATSADGVFTVALSDGLGVSTDMDFSFMVVQIVGGVEIPVTPPPP